ncbi:DUF998 domain-containing protein [Spiractinospora alimapuensis]|uniref:DUF998 domain-containing protein n=1 Tax=Spiractinospora alimapuensis TaxID=2820884 RepID=UPI001F3EA7DF|nr:DUF998 domain-containing protein [Spiractinospora alimapuensis]QVQ52990.1 DUF998 domain-containing protein [Spiractinospora alimapuensis]
MLPNRLLLRCGLAAGPLFVTVFTVAGALRPDYSPVRHPVSSLALTGWGWVQVANFLLAGALLLALAVGMRRVGPRPVRGATPWLLGLGGVGLMGAGVFPGDPVSGYPPGTPDTLVYTPPGVAHDAFSVLFFLCVAAAGGALSVRCARERRWGLAVYSLLSAILFLVLLVVASSGFEQDPALVDYGGLIQRASLVVGFAWTTVVAAALLRGAERDRSDSGAPTAAR